MTPTPILDFSAGPLAEGLRCYRAGQFWEAHEHWEGVWLAAAEPEKTLIQSLIQISAAFHHVQRGNLVGALSLLSRALRRLEPFPCEYAGVDVDGIRAIVREWVRALESGVTGEVGYPRIGW